MPLRLVVRAFEFEVIPNPVPLGDSRTPTLVLQLLLVLLGPLLARSYRQQALTPVRRI